LAPSRTNYVSQQETLQSPGRASFRERVAIRSRSRDSRVIAYAGYGIDWLNVFQTKRAPD